MTSLVSHVSKPTARVAIAAIPSRPAIRRTVVLLGVALSLVLAAATIRIAADWAASSAPLAVPPASLTSIESALAGERARSAALQAQLDSLRASSDQLSNALAAANDRLVTDQTTADGLRSDLAAAQQKLATLEAALKAAAAKARPAGTTTRSSSGGSTEVEVGDD
ncbi:MAG TPA: hypothetical protein VF484_00955 [Candidatus Limnocylindrales bacterium]